MRCSTCATRTRSAAASSPTNPKPNPNPTVTVTVTPTLTLTLTLTLTQVCCGFKPDPADPHRKLLRSESDAKQALFDLQGLASH